MRIRQHIAKHKKKYIAAVLAVASTATIALHQAPASPAPTPPIAIVNPTPAPTPTPVSTACNPSLWNFVYHPARLPSKTDCRSITGIVAWDKVEPDGDYHIRLKLDDPNSAPVNAKNIGGYLVVEPICQVTPTQADAIQPCSTYSGPKFPLPSVGSHIQISGYYTLDAQHGWMEMHTVNNLIVIK